MEARAVPREGRRWARPPTPRASCPCAKARLSPAGHRRGAEGPSPPDEAAERDPQGLRPETCATKGKAGRRCQPGRRCGHWGRPLGTRGCQRSCCQGQGRPNSRSQLATRLLRRPAGDTRALRKQGEHPQSQQESPRGCPGCAAWANGPGVTKLTLMAASVCCTETTPGPQPGGTGSTAQAA